MELQKSFATKLEGMLPADIVAPDLTDRHFRDVCMRG
jgi:hypothetical protein